MIRKNICITGIFLLRVLRCIINKRTYRISHGTRAKHEEAQNDQEAAQVTQGLHGSLRQHNIRMAHSSILFRTLAITACQN